MIENHARIAPKKIPLLSIKLFSYAIHHTEGTYYLKQDNRIHISTNLYGSYMRVYTRPVEHVDKPFQKVQT